MHLQRLGFSWEFGAGLGEGGEEEALQHVFSPKASAKFPAESASLHMWASVLGGQPCHCSCEEVTSARNLVLAPGGKSCNLFLKLLQCRVPGLRTRERHFALLTQLEMWGASLAQPLPSSS